MAKKERKKVVIVREHTMHVPVSKKNPMGITIRDRHPRRLKGTYLDREEIESAFKAYDRKGIIFPASKKLNHKSSDKYDDLIAVWTDYFNRKFEANPPLDPDVVKALIASESGFHEDRKKRLAEGKLGRAATAEEIILEYKGLLKSKSDEKTRALENFRKNYGKLKGK